ncbi:MAG: PDZ domain-containing protein [Candidatus Omnitrophica bacterium]|nr:PDZ domain-containing protein [Candidatus Omnitrophota bacterium]
MPDQINLYQKIRKQRIFLFSGLAILGVLIVAALMHIGAGDAEWGGMTVSNQTPAIMMEFGIPKGEKGVIVNWAEDPAYTAGIRSGDMIKAINNKPVTDLKDFLNVTKVTNLDQGVLLDILRHAQPLYITMENKVGVHDTLKKALGLDMGVTGQAADPATVADPAGTTPTTLSAGAHQVALNNQSPVETAEAQALNPALPQRAPTGKLPTPKEQGAAQKEIIEGHWLGVELIPLTPELATEFKIPADINGVLVDEISLESAESGILAGDMIVGVDGFATPDLVSFTEATRRVKNKHKAQVVVSRRGKVMEFTFTSLRTLGFSQNEAAQPIRPGALAPHRIRNKPCTSCHIIMVTGGQLPTDAGDILPNPPPIAKGAVAPHEYRGTCKTCHIMLRPAL